MTLSDHFLQGIADMFEFHDASLEILKPPGGNRSYRAAPSTAIVQPQQFADLFKLAAWPILYMTVSRDEAAMKA